MIKVQLNSLLYVYLTIINYLFYNCLKKTIDVLPRVLGAEHGVFATLHGLEGFSVLDALPAKLPRSGFGREKPGGVEDRILAFDIHGARRRRLFAVVLRLGLGRSQLRLGMDMGYKPRQSRPLLLVHVPAGSPRGKCVRGLLALRVALCFGLCDLRRRPLFSVVLCDLPRRLHPDLRRAQRSGRLGLDAKPPPHRHYVCLCILHRLHRVVTRHLCCVVMRSGE